MTDICSVLKQQGFRCPKCGHLWPRDAEYWHRTTLPMGNDNIFIAALCRACTDSGPTRKQVTAHKTMLRADRAGRITGTYFMMSPDSWLPPSPSIFFDHTI